MPALADRPLPQGQQGSWKIAALADEPAAANERLAPVRDRPAGLFTRAETFVKRFFGRRDERETPKAIKERQPAPDHRTPEGLRQIRTLTERAIDMLDRIRALPDREAPERAVERPEAPSVAREVIEAVQRAREARVSPREASEELSRVP